MLRSDRGLSDPKTEVSRACWVAVETEFPSKRPLPRLGAFTPGGTTTAECQYTASWVADECRKYENVAVAAGGAG